MNSRERFFSLLNELKVNNTNTITFYRSNKRYEKTYCEFSFDVDQVLSRLNYLKHSIGIAKVAIIGPISYDWIVSDIACIKGGFLSIAIPETLPKEQVINIVEKTNTDIVLMDFSLADKYNSIHNQVYYIECNTKEIESNLWKQQKINNNFVVENLILEEYSIVFSSGTSKEIKFIKKIFRNIEKEEESFLEQIKQIAYYIRYGKSLWSRKNNKLLIFMPFSHSQQRDFFRMALLKKINIVLSDHKNCIKHIIIENPNIMVSVPVIYEAMAERIKIKIGKFNGIQQLFYKFFNILRINTFLNGNYIKRIFSFFLFKEIRKIYGGRADYFITGSAPISDEVVRVFYGIGVKLFQAYGQTETGNIAMNTPFDFKIGSVGKPIKKIRISDESEILVKYNMNRHSCNKEILNIDNNEYIHTGDLGYLDKEGFLFIIGRKDDVIVLENGEKVFPDRIESFIKSSEIVKDVCVFSKGYKLYAVLNCFGYNDKNKLAVKKWIQCINNELSIYEKIYGYHIAEYPFSHENELLTATFKKKRNDIIKYYWNYEFIII